MTAAIIYGASSGALHAVSGPDHVLSLGPVALAHPRDSWRIGLRWGLGHALGTVCLAIPLLLVSGMVSLSFAASFGNRLAGVALLAMAAWSWRASCGPLHSKPDDGATSKPFAVGLVHGVTGAGSLLLMVPVLVSNDVAAALFFLAAFSLGSAAAMATLTWGIARVGKRLNGSAQARVRTCLLAAGAALGAYWLIAG